ncbi:MAG: MarR family transcriptional regulator [Acidimicrobiales bacterium]
MARRATALTDADFERLLDFRDGLRRFLRWSEDEAKHVGLTGPQHQLLLAIRGHGHPPSIGQISAHLLLKHHSTVELVDRAERAGLIKRESDADDHRVVRLSLTRSGEAKLVALTDAHVEELRRLRPQLERLWERLPE